LRLLAIVVIGFVFVLAWTPTIRCEPSKSPHAFADLEKRLVRDGFDKSFVRAIYSRPEVHFGQQGITAYFSHREALLNYDQFSSRSSIKPALKYLKKHRKALQRTQKAYGVEPGVITAIILVESNLGKLVGNRLVVNTLSSLAALGDKTNQDAVWRTHGKGKKGYSRAQFDTWAGRKSAWAYKELKAYLKHVRAEDMDPSSMYGSFAGALGIAQFMPTSVLQYAKDGNQDGRINLYHHEDSIESIANYLKQHGWRPGLSRRKAFQVVLRYNNSKYYADAILKVAERLSGLKWK
jgi:membrane-bound lytic murein transglycosylase B